MISQLETSSPQEILLVSKIINDISLLSGTGVSVTPEIRIPNKRNFKSQEISSPREGPITSKDINRIITQKYPNLPPNLEK